MLAPNNNNNKKLLGWPLFSLIRLYYAISWSVWNRDPIISTWNRNKIARRAR